MTPQQYERLTELFHAALGLALTERELFLGHLSQSDAELRSELESLLAVEATPLIEKPPDDIAAGYLAQQGDSSFSVQLLAPHTRLDHYEICSLLGKGAMGEVYLAEDMRLRRKVALKILPAKFAADRERMRRFEQEATAAAALNHPHIAHIYETGQSEGTHFIALEHVDGVTLRHKIHHDKAPLQKLLKYLTQVAEGLAKAHAAGIVHRDIKPDNIMITRDDYTKILDFGLAKLIEPEQLIDSAASSEVNTAILAQQSLAGTVMGTPGYMSPEQAQGKVKEIDHRSDIFSFGCILFEAVTRQRPFAAESIIKSLHNLVYVSAPPINSVNPSAPPELQRIVRLCLAKDPDERYQTIKEVALELKEVRQVIAGRSDLDTTAPPLGSIETSGRPGIEQSTRSTSSVEYLAATIKRHRKRGAVILAVLALMIGYGFYRFAIQRKVGTSSPTIKMTRLTATGKVLTGSISPDGKHVVYVVDDAAQQSIWVRQVERSSNVQIVSPSEASYGSLSFSRDSNYLYFNKREGNAPTSLYQMPLLGGMARKIVENVSSGGALSYDRSRIAFIRGDPFEKENSLVVASSSGSGEQVLATRKGPDNFAGGIAWRPDGTSVTCVAGNHAQKLIEIPLDGSAEKSVKTPKWFAIIRIEWLPDGTGLIVAALEQSRSSPLQIWHLSFPSGEARRITNDFSNYTNLSLTADASALVVIKRETTSNIWIAPEGDASRAKQLTTGSGREDGNPNVNWASDGRIVYDSAASGFRHTWIMNADGSDQRQLNDGPYEDQGAHVSPDGRYVVFTSNRTGIYHIYRMDIDSNNLKQLTNGPGELAPFFSPDGDWVICSSGNYRSWKVRADGGELVRLNDNGWASSISPDGKLVAYVRPSGAGPLFWNIMIMPFETSQPLNTFEVKSISRPNSWWTSDGRAIIYNLTHGGVLSGVTNLWYQSLEGGPPKQLTNFTAGTFFGFDWSRDGRMLAYGRGNVSSDVVLISDFR